MTIMIPAWVEGELVPVEKLEAHQRGLRHKAVSVFVLKGTKVLMQQRAMGKYHTPGLWTNTCCTHPDFDEDPARCAVRRLEEELGITGLIPVHRHHLEYRADVGGGLIEHEVVDVYLARAQDDLVVRPNPEEVMAIEWVDYHDLMARVARRSEDYTPWLQIYLSEHSDRIFGPDLISAARLNV